MSHPSRDHDFAGIPDTATPAEAHALAAREQAARFAADLAIARWSVGRAFAQGEGVSARADWYARRQQDLQQWFAEGGFRACQDAGDADCSSVDAATLPFPGIRPRFYTLSRTVRTTMD